MQRRALAGDGNGPLRKQLDLKEMASFSWDDVLNWANGKAPFLVACLKGMFPKPLNGSLKHSRYDTQFVGSPIYLLLIFVL